MPLGMGVATRMAVRPVVSLKSDITVEDLSVSSSKNDEEDWTTLTSYAYTYLEYGEITE
jgi:hypothetical protein